MRTISGCFGDPRAKTKIWIEIAHRLNMLEGTLKTSSKWAKYWNDIVIYTKTRAVNGCKEFKHERPASSIDKRILKIIGQDHLLKSWNKRVPLDNLKEPETYDDEEDVENELDSILTDKQLIEVLEDGETSEYLENGEQIKVEYLENEDISFTIQNSGSSINETANHLKTLVKKRKFEEVGEEGVGNEVGEDGKTVNNEELGLKDVVPTLNAISDALIDLATALKKCAAAIDKCK